MKLEITKQYFTDFESHKPKKKIEWIGKGIWHQINNPYDDFERYKSEITQQQLYEMLVDMGTGFLDEDKENNNQFTLRNRYGLDGY